MIFFFLVVVVESGSCKHKIHNSSKKPRTIIWIIEKLKKNSFESRAFLLIKLNNDNNWVAKLVDLVMLK